MESPNPQSPNPQSQNPQSQNPRAIEAQVGEDISSQHDELLNDPKCNELSTEYIGRWSQLVSTTNWEKGRIILEWREALEGSEAAPASYSDEAWSRRVGGVTPQHVGRLRRVYERFGTSFATYHGIYWSHFLAALEWDDAEMWLEGASQSGWSVSQMRRTRWEAAGNVGEVPPAVETLAANDDEDYAPLSEVDETTGTEDGPRTVAEGPRYDEPDFGEEFDAGAAVRDSSSDEDELPWEEPAAATATPSPFAQLPSLPVDIAEALEQFKLAIIRHRADGWGEVAQTDVIKAIDALRRFAGM